jgi:hypothetical protein
MTLHVVIRELYEAKGKMLERLLSIVRPFDSPSPELNDEGGREVTAKRIYKKYA